MYPAWPLSSAHDSHLCSKSRRRRQMTGVPCSRRHICRHRLILPRNAALQNNHFPLEAAHFIFLKSRPTYPRMGKLTGPTRSRSRTACPTAVDPPPVDASSCRGSDPRPAPYLRLSCLHGPCCQHLSILPKLLLSQ